MTFILAIDHVLLTVWYAVLQASLIPVAVLWISGRFIGLLKTRNSLVYGCIGAMHLGLMFLDFFLYRMNQTMSLKTFLIFFGLNALLGISILRDINNRIQVTKRNRR